MHLDGKVCLVTGAARRVGRAIALAFAARGATLAIHYRESEAEAAETARECERLNGGRGVAAFRADLSDPAAIESLVSEVETRFGGIDILVNNAAVFRATPFAEMTVAQWDEIFRVNVRGPAWLCKCVAPVMRRRGEGAIVNVSDIGGDAPWPRFVPYCAAKAALTSMTLGLARELAPAIRVNAIAPGAVLLPPAASASLAERIARGVPLERIGSPEDVADAAVFLAGSAYITGAVIPVDGGAHLAGGLASE